MEVEDKLVKLANKMSKVTNKSLKPANKLESLPQKVLVWTLNYHFM